MVDVLTKINYGIHMKTEHIVVKATKEFKLKVKSAADSDNINMSQYVTQCILADMERREYANNKKART